MVYGFFFFFTHALQRLRSHMLHLFRSPQARSHPAEASAPAGDCAAPQQQSLRTLASRYVQHCRQALVATTTTTSSSSAAAAPAAAAAATTLPSSSSASSAASGTSAPLPSSSSSRLLDPLSALSFRLRQHVSVLTNTSLFSHQGSLPLIRHPHLPITLSGWLNTATAAAPAATHVGRGD